jgi:site-specific DNA-methyltransferase (adenine-specific)
MAEKVVIGNAELWHGDCREVLAELKAGAVDVVVTDPPFFAPASHYQSRVSWGRAWADLSILGQYFYDLAKECKRVMKDDGHLLCFCNDESFPVFYPGVYGLWDFSKGLVWDKTRIGLGKIFRHQHELILWASNSGAYAVSDGKMHSDILRHAPTLSADREHPVQKPPALMAELISVLTRPGAVVFDGFMGSATTGEAALSMGRQFIGVELERRYFDVACERISRAHAQGSLLPEQARECVQEGLL